MVREGESQMIRYKVLSRRPDVERVEVFVFTFQSVHHFSRILVMGEGKDLYRKHIPRFRRSSVRMQCPRSRYTVLPSMLFSKLQGKN